MDAPLAVAAGGASAGFSRIDARSSFLIADMDAVFKSDML
jgi:hypothetical protein